MTTTTQGDRSQMWRAAINEFPDYPINDLPDMLPDFEDGSWHNDAAPSMHSHQHDLRIFIDYVDPAQREMGPDGKRFYVGKLGDSTELYDSDDWRDVVAFVHKRTHPRTLEDVRDLMVELLQQGNAHDIAHITVRPHDAPDHICIGYDDGSEYLLSVELAKAADDVDPMIAHERGGWRKREDF